MRLLLWLKQLMRILCHTKYFFIINELALFEKMSQIFDKEKQQKTDSLDRSLSAYFKSFQANMFKTRAKVYLD